MNAPTDAGSLERLQAALVAHVGGCSGWEFDGADAAGGFRFSCDCGVASGTYATYAEGTRALDGFPEAIREFVQSWFTEHPPVTGDVFGHGWSVRLEASAEPDPPNRPAPDASLVSSGTSRGPETEPVDDDAQDEPWDGYLLPVIDFHVYGCDETWTGPRWLDFVQFHYAGMEGEAVTEVWTAHGDSRVFDPASPSIRVGTLPLTSAERRLAGSDHDVTREAAFTAAFALLDRTEPELPDPQLGQLLRAALSSCPPTPPGSGSSTPAQQLPARLRQLDRHPIPQHTQPPTGRWAGGHPSPRR